MPQVYDKPDTEPTSSEESVGKNAVSEDEQRSIAGVSPQELKDKEEKAGEDTQAPEGAEEDEEPIEGQGSLFEKKVGKGYRRDNPERLAGMKPSASGVFNFARANRGKLIVGGSATGIITLLIVGFFILVPFKILHIVNNLQSRFYASSENAVQKETDVLFSDYVKRYVIPGLNSCKGSTIDKSCTPKAIQGTSIISKLYQGWSTARLENTMADKYGLEFKKVGSHFYLKAPGMTGDGANIDSFVNPGQQQLFSLDDYMAQSQDSQFQKVNRAQLRQTYQDALAKETKWKQVMYRYKVGGLLARKYGLKRCIIACGTRDNFNDWKDNKTRAAKLILVERVLGPRSEVLSIVVQCVISNDPLCDPTNLSDTGSDGRKQSDVQTRLQQKVAALAAQDTGKYADVVAHTSGILKDGYQKYIARQIVKAMIGKFGGDTAATETADKITSSLVPIVGWVNTASNTIGTLEKAPAKIKAFSYLTNATAMVSLYTTYRVFTDECKTGNCDPTILGSFANQLDPGDKSSTGGGVGAEQTPLYSQLIDGQNTANSNSPYKCNNGNPIPAGQTVCQEEVLGGNNGVLGSIKTALNNLGPLKTVADVWNSTLGKVFNAAAGVIGSVTNFLISITPGHQAVESAVGNAVQPIISSFTDYLIPSPFSENMSGGRTFDLMAGGADVSGNDYAQNGLGGKALTSTQAANILAEQTQSDIQSYKNESFFARIFDTNSNYSLTTKLAMAMPNSWSSAGSSIASIFSNPLAKLKNSFASLFNLNNYAFAGATPQADPFGVTQYGYPSGDANLVAANANPEKYWADNCSTDGTTLDWTKGSNSAWQNTQTQDPNTGMPANDTTNPCLLLQSTVGSAGAVYDASLLTPDDTASN